MSLLHGWVEALGWAFLHFLWQGALVWAGTALFMHVLPGARARYRVACAALGLCLLLPALGVARRLPGGLPARVETVAMGPSMPGTAPALAPRAAWPVRAQAALDAHLSLVVLLWAVGASLLALRLASGLAWVQKLERREARPADPGWERRMSRLAKAMAISRRIVLKVSEAVDSPVSFGWWRPVILMPAALVAGMDPCLLEALLAHELAHVRRLDYLANLLQTCVEILLFYHPGVWWLSRRIRAEREVLCDALAAETLGEPRRLVLALRELDQFQFSPTHLAQAAHGGSLMHRIRRLIQPEPRPLAWKVLLAVAGFTTLCGASAAAFGHAQAPAPHPAKAPEAAFAIVSKDKDGITRSGPGASTRELHDLKTRLGKDYVWFRAKGQGYVITDPALVARATALWQPVEDLGHQMGELGKEMGALGAKQGELGAQQGTVGAKQGAIGARQGDIGRQMGEIGRQQERLNRQLEKAEEKLEDEHLSPADKATAQKHVDELEKTLSGLDKKMDALEAQMEALGQEMEEAAKPMEELGHKMEEAAKPMEELGRKMDDLGKQMKVKEKEASAGMDKLIAEAQASGKATRSDKVK